MAVFDSYGKNGHLISTYVKNYFHLQFQIINKQELYKVLTNNNYEHIKQLFLNCHKNLIKSKIDCLLPELHVF